MPNEPADELAPTAPAANAGPDQAATPRTTVQLSGAASHDADGDPQIYESEILDA